MRIASAKIQGLYEIEELMKGKTLFIVELAVKHGGNILFGKPCAQRMAVNADSPGKRIAKHLDGKKIEWIERQPLRIEFGSIERLGSVLVGLALFQFVNKPCECAEPCINRGAGRFGRPVNEQFVRMI